MVPTEMIQPDPQKALA
jgi:hypothetical protein